MIKEKKNISDWQIQAKYAIDRALGVTGTCALLPVLSAISLAIRLEDNGPVFFVQQRPGLGAKPFNCYKFRTMIMDADQYLDEDGKPTRNRITRVGSLLRKTSLDELPQIINIALGDMSFIGPRPPMMIHLKRYNEAQMGRFRMKPGITGLAQVSGRNFLKWTRRLELDNKYIENYSLFTDIKIALKTIKVILFREGIAPDRNPDEVDDLPPPRD